LIRQSPPFSAIVPLGGWMRKARESLLSLLVALARPLTLLVFVVALATTYSITSRVNWPIIRSDGEGYYAYLRLYFIHRRLDFDSLPMPSGSLAVDVLKRSMVTGRLANLYPVGTAVAEFPFFLVGHALAKIGGWRRDGWSPPYQYAILAAGLFWLGVGVWTTWLFIAQRLGHQVAGLAILGVGLGTNLLHYAAVEPSMSHVYGFGAMGLMLWSSDRFWQQASTWSALRLGGAIGLLVTIRQYNCVLVPLALYPAWSQWRKLRSHGLPLFAGLLATVMPQMLVAAYYFGAPWRQGYGMIPLNWNRPQVLNVLVSVRKGWWFWTPIAAVGVAGLVSGLQTAHRLFCVLSILGIGAVVGITSSWPVWWMGASFGHRGFIDLLPVIAVGLALLLRHTAIKGLLGLSIVLNLFLTWQYWHGEVGQDMTWKAYRQVLVTPILAVTGHTTSKDSQRPEGLAAAVVIDVQREAAYLTVKAIARNSGNTIWRADPGRGQVVLDVRAFDQQSCQGSPLWEWREPILTDVSPGQTVAITASIPLDRLRRRFQFVCGEMLAESVAWFRDLGSLPAVVALDETIMRWSEFLK
jgi:hypothetical protein